MSKNNSLLYFFKQFPDEKSCRKYLEERKWGNNPVCPHCGSSQKIYRYKDDKTFKCACCNKQFKVTTKTIYENSNIPLQKWFLTFYLISLSKKGISSIELSKTLDITQKSAWYLLHKIRYMLQHNDSDNQLKGIVECDETYFGGKKKGKRGRGSENKTPIFGAVQRKGRLSISPVKDTKRKTLEPIIHKVIKENTHIMSDEWHAYRKLDSNYEHSVVKHRIKEYVRGDVHTNTIEGAWSHLKRSLMGTYHRPSKEHLDKYCAEFQFNYNTRNNSPEIKFRKTIDKNNIRIKYKDIT
ncbi:MAG: family transposase [Bacteroidetes bacterium]|nr:family transposase [Bacteroidota bacterium]